MESEEPRSFSLPEGLEPHEYETLLRNAPPEIRKLLNRNLDPCQFSDEEFGKKTGLTREQFAERVELFSACDLSLSALGCRITSAPILHKEKTQPFF